MKKFSMAVGAAIALAGVTAPARAQTVSSTTGTTSNVTSIDESIYGKDMGGMKVTAKFNGQSDIIGIWGQLSATNWGVSFGGFGSITVGTNTNTYSGANPDSDQMGPWKVNLLTSTDLNYLIFEGGALYGGVLFDRSCRNNSASTSNCSGFGTGTAQSSVGDDYDFTGNSYDSDFNGVTAAYTNAVGLGVATPVGDLYSKVTVDFTGFGYSYRCGYRLRETCFNDEGPDSDQNRINFFMDTDKGVFAGSPNIQTTVPEPSTYALMGAGLMGIFGFARRRNRNA